MLEIRNHSDLVRKILECEPVTRDSDDLLYIAVVRAYHPELMNARFIDVMFHISDFKLPTYETVSRLRRKHQRDDESLKPSKTVADFRFENWKEVRDYVTE